MAELRIRTIDESELETVLAEDLEFDGTIEHADPLLVKGRLSGEVHAQADLYIAASAVLDADIEAARVSVKGTVHGDITATERIELFSGATIGGNIRTPDLIIQSGSHFTGTCRMDDPVKAHAKADKDRDGKNDAKESSGEETV
ncbi:MAG: polymer-forming cytoskeletal protein [Spirochaetaceae bacterium]|nr:MAG: polymer-forming cytoskeletal protein [Spirochaetaceae bacterium]